MSDRWILPATLRAKAQGYERDESVPLQGVIKVSFWLKANKPVIQGAREMLAEPLKARKYLSPQDLGAQYGSNPDARRAVLAFADKHHFPATYSSETSRQITLTVPVDKVEELFGDKLSIYTRPGHPNYRGREGSISLSEEDFSRDAAAEIVGVFGLDNRMQARRFASVAENRDQAPAAAAGPVGAPPSAFPPATYGFPVNPGMNQPHTPQGPPLTGAGQCIGIIGFGGTVRDGLFTGMGTPGQIEVAPPQEITQGDPNKFMSETLLDVDIASRCAPGAHIAVYAFDQTEQGWTSGLNGILETDPIPSVLSISWGWPEQLSGQDLWTKAAIDTVEDLLAAMALRGVTVVVSSGDLGGIAQYPASSEFVLSCGGTVNPVADEQVWNNQHNASGGGVSAFIEKPVWQTNAIQCVGPLNQPQPSQKRCFPDVAALAVYSSPVVPLQTEGTSAAAPQWSALMALANQFLNQSGLPSVGHFNSYLYDTGSNIQQSLHDILNGGSALGQRVSYIAKPKWDACTGWGTPRVMPFIQALAAASARPPGN
jgi:kumamolisin